MEKIVFAFTDEFKMSDSVMNELAEKYGDRMQFAMVSDCDEHQLQQASAFIGEPEDAVIRAMPNLRWLQLPSAGANRYAGHPDLRDEVIVTNASGVFGAAGAEHILALLLAFVRRLPLFFRQAEKHIWKRELRMLQLEGATVCIVGLGDIGSQTAVRLKAFGSRIVAVKRTMTERPDYVDALYDIRGLNDAVRQSDFVVNILPLTEETRGLFDKELFSQMKRGTIFINAGRGESVEEPALIDALESGRLAGAGLDVTSREPLPKDSPLWDMSNVIITSHSLGASPGKLKKRSELIKHNLENFISGKPLINRVNRKRGY